MSTTENEFDRRRRAWYTNQPDSERVALIAEYVRLTKDLPRAQLLQKFLLTTQRNTLTWFDEPCSTKYHGATLGGLAKHSFSVYYQLKSLNEKLPRDQQLTEESLVICGVYHDLCKCGLYFPKVNKKDGMLAAKPFEIQDDFPFGHGEKSVVMIQGILREFNEKLTDLEAILIRWHMGPFDFSYKGMQSYLAKKYQYHLLLYCADHFVTMLEGSSDEGNKEWE